MGTLVPLIDEAKALISHKNLEGIGALAPLIDEAKAIVSQILNVYKTFFKPILISLMLEYGEII